MSDKPQELNQYENKVLVKIRIGVEHEYLLLDVEHFNFIEFWSPSHIQLTNDTQQSWKQTFENKIVGASEINQYIQDHQCKLSERKILHDSTNHSSEPSEKEIVEFLFQYQNEPGIIYEKYVYLVSFYLNYHDRYLMEQVCDMQAGWYDNDNEQCNAFLVSFFA